MGEEGEGEASYDESTSMMDDSWRYRGWGSVTKSCAAFLPPTPLECFRIGKLG